MREIACIGCKYHEAEAKYNQMLQGLVIEHYCRKTGKRFKLFHFREEAPEKCPYRNLEGAEKIE